MENIRWYWKTITLDENRVLLYTATKEGSKKKLYVIGFYVLGVKLAKMLDADGIISIIIPKGALPQEFKLDNVSVTNPRGDIPFYSPEDVAEVFGITDPEEQQVISILIFAASYMRKKRLGQVKIDLIEKEYKMKVSGSQMPEGFI